MGHAPDLAVVRSSGRNHDPFGASHHGGDQGLHVTLMQREERRGSGPGAPVFGIRTKDESESSSMGKFDTPSWPTTASTTSKEIADRFVRIDFIKLDRSSPTGNSTLSLATIARPAGSLPSSIFVVTMGDTTTRQRPSFCPCGERLALLFARL
jgi:hypothetical protein